MTSSARSLLDLTLTAESVNLFADNYKESKKRKPKIVQQAVKNIGAIALLKAQSDIIGGFP